MKLSYTPTLADYRAALRLYRRQKLSRRILHYASTGLLSLFAVLAWALFIYNMGTEPTSFPGSLSLPIGITFWLLLAYLMRQYVVRKQFKQIFPPSRTDRTVSIDIDNDRIISAIPGVSEGKFFWNAILDFAQDERITLLYVAKNRFLFVPTQAFSDAERDELRGLISRNLKRS